MLAPEDRHLLTDALRPPDGHAVDVAVATTYTLDLQSVLLAPLAMAAYDQTRSVESDGSTPLALLESVRRHAGHTTVFCQAAGIHVPPDYPRLAAFAEGCVLEVPPPAGYTFHPKIWAIRFVGSDGGHRHRFICLSRNLTGDDSWDTVLVCDEEAGGALDPEPMSVFIQDLLDRATRVDAARREQVSDLCATLRAVRLAVPEPFTSGKVIALGTGASSDWPLPDRADRWAVVSPFLDAASVRRLPQTAGSAVLISRPDTYERLGADGCGTAELRVLQPDADSPDEEDEAGSERHRGLHAKVFAWDLGAQGNLLVGSANCTSAAFSGNVELSVLLSGPVNTCGVARTLGSDDEGFLKLSQAFSPSQDEATPDPVYEAERTIEAWHAALAAADPLLTVTAAGSGYDVRLDLDLGDVADPQDLASLTVVSLVDSKSRARKPLTGEPSWRGVGLAGLSPYLAVSTSIDVDGKPVTRECVLVCRVEGVPPDRQSQLLRDLLSRPEDVMRYLVLLLGDPAVGDAFDHLFDRTKLEPDLLADPDPAAGRQAPTFDDLVLVEPLVRASARADESLERVQRLFEDLRDINGELPQVGAEFLELWRVVWEART